MRDFNDKVVAITGVGSGIGRALAVAFDRAGARLALSDIAAAGLEETATKLRRSAHLRVLDVADRSAVYAWKDEILGEYGQVDILVNNAGVAMAQTVENLDYADFEWVMNIDFWGVVYGTKAFLPELKKRPEAAIVNISSVFGLIGVPTQSVYNAAKFAVRGFTEALRHELEAEGSSVRAHCVHPGGIKTNVARHGRLYRDMDGSSNTADMVARFEQNARNTPELAATMIINGIHKRQPRILIGNDARILDIVQRCLPVSYWRILRRLMI